MPNKLLTSGPPLVAFGLCAIVRLRLCPDFFRGCLQEFWLGTREQRQTVAQLSIAPRRTRGCPPRGSGRHNAVLLRHLRSRRRFGRQRRVAKFLIDRLNRPAPSRGGRDAGSWLVLAPDLLAANAQAAHPVRRGWCCCSLTVPRLRNPVPGSAPEGLVRRRARSQGWPMRPRPGQLQSVLTRAAVNIASTERSD